MAKEAGCTYTYVEAITEDGLKRQKERIESAIKGLQGEIDDKGNKCCGDCDKCKWYIERGTYDDFNIQCGLIYAKEVIEDFQSTLTSCTEALKLF